MSGHREYVERNEEERKRLSMLSSACLRISRSLDLKMVLNEILRSSSELTEARYGAIVTVDESGQPEEFVTSGFTAKAHRLLADWSEGPELFKYFRDLDGVLNLPDAREYVRSLGFASDRLPTGSFLGSSMRHQDQHVGNFYLVEKKNGREFTSEDEEILSLFAYQAATSIANARTHQAEQHIRADLEALVDISPVGVAVFDVRTGQPSLLNREAKRIVEYLCLPGQSPKELLEVLTCRLADGRQFALEELPFSQVLDSSETLRAEEIVLSVPDGRSISSLINVAPIKSDSGSVVSVIVTIQDLAPIEELERVRVEFLSKVSHELRAPLASIKGSAATVLEESLRFDLIEMREFFRIILEQADRMSTLISDLLDVGRIESGTLTVTPKPCDIAALLNSARTTFESGSERRSVQIDIPPDLPPVMADRQRIEQVLINLLSNAARHSPESSTIRVSVGYSEMHIAISVSDEGIGIAPDRLPHLFRKYSVQENENRKPEIEHTGLGLAICKGLVETHGGRIWAESQGIGRGTCLTFTIPVAEESSLNVRESVRLDPHGFVGGEKTRILVIDDDPQTLHYVRTALKDAGFDTLVTCDLPDLSNIIQTEKPELILLDLMLPDTDGIALMETVPELSYLPVIFISAYGRDETIARALEAGAVDYLVKPVSAIELVARVRASLRKAAGPVNFRSGKLTIDYDRREVSLDGFKVDLTTTEYELLRVLSINAGHVLTYEILIRQVWSTRRYADAKLVRAFVKQLRRKLGDSARSPTYIFNERNVGYRMAEPA